MKKAIVIFSVMLSVCSCGGAASDDVKVMSYNIRYDNPDDGENIWDNRKPATVGMLRDIHPDIFGVQEAMVNQVRYIEENCPEYISIGVGRDDGKEGGEFMSIFYDKNKIEVIDSGTIWLSQTPEKPGRGWDAACFRTCTWGLFRCIGSGRKFYYANTHLDHIGKVARKEGLALILKFIGGMNTCNYPFILTGDFNMAPSDHALEPVAAVMTNAAGDNSIPTCNKWGRKPGTMIDYIFHTGFSLCKDYRVIDRQYAEIPYLSDHWPITATLAF